MARALVAGGVSIEVQLVVLLSSPPLASGSKLGDNAVLPPLLVCLGGDLARNLLLLGVVVVDGRAVLGAGVGALLVEGCGIVHAVEKFEELFV